MFQAQVGSHHISASHLSVDVFDNMGGNVEDMVWISGGYQLKVDHTIYQNGAMGLALASAPGHTGVINGLGLPASYDLASFDANFTLTYGYAQIDGGPGQQLFQFTPLSITAVPEAGSVEMAVTGLLGVGVFMRLRQRRA